MRGGKTQGEDRIRLRAAVNHVWDTLEQRGTEGYFMWMLQAYPWMAEEIQKRKQEWAFMSNIRERVVRTLHIDNPDYTFVYEGVSADVNLDDVRLPDTAVTLGSPINTTAIAQWRSREIATSTIATSTIATTTIAPTTVATPFDDTQTRDQPDDTLVYHAAGQQLRYIKARIAVLSDQQKSLEEYIEALQRFARASDRGRYPG
ncbi:uncharacterized protein B0H18DRAFT_960554 [Fomitopsis serialis]|uniref:uncharacterized protein n=1 Tax=Fomitopsis serialis TaxID=139415 RepID=UPI0020084F45|nr:uncharacterized protein B0H18DRAFT_960554 [Neoantrodia serialis]KAH9913189.1 hypothetical protein B0H18DRAFT_960554 [Neoantrodia serialis]